ncbi:MAG TPA: MarC family protein [Byssovorax sp.]|jgi:multiple antibiotic resistance protein
MVAGLAFFTVCFPSMLSIVDPFAAAPIYLALTGRDERPEQRRTAMRATLTALVVLCLFAAAGTAIFGFFGITIPAFKLAGGALLFLMALDMMRAKPSGARSTLEERNEAQNQEEVGVIPIGVPVLSGPGAIATVMMWSSRASLVADKLALYVSVGLVCAITLVTLLSAARVVGFLGKVGINVITRIMGLILAASAAQFIIDGWRAAML